MVEPTSTEVEAVYLRWRALHPEASPDGQPSQEEFERLLADIRQRAIDIENEALSLVVKRMRIKPAARAKPLRAVLPTVVAILIGAAIFVGVIYVMTHR